MYKLKDDFDINKLTEFGFKIDTKHYNYLLYDREIDGSWFDYIIVSFETRKVYMYHMIPERKNLFQNLKYYIKDLIKANVVEEIKE